MANLVQNYIKIKNINKNVVDELERIFSKTDQYGDTHTIDLINGIFDMEWTEDDYDRGWVNENVGAKWVYGQIETEYENEIIINLTSAWDAVNPLLKELCTKLMNIKDDVVIENTFEDESCDPMGVAYYSSEYGSVEYLDEEVDVNKFWEDDTYREEIYEILEGMMQDERNIHQEVIEELNTDIEE